MKWEEEFKEQAVLRMSENLPRVKKCLNLLTTQQIWQRPNAQSNSIGNLILHLCGNITQYINASLGEEKDERNRDLEFTSTEKMNAEELYGKFEEVFLKAILIILKTDKKELLKSRKVQGFTLTGMGIILHVTEHLLYHVGQIAFYTKQLTNTDLGFYADMDLNVKNEI